jgi:hypothetical protein
VPAILTGLKIDLMCLPRAGNLTKFLHETTGVPLDCIVAYLSDGRLLQESGFPESLLTSQEVSKALWSQDCVDYSASRSLCSTSNS